MEKNTPAVNVFDEPLESCCNNPATGFFRDGYCNTNDQDLGSHTVCVKVTQSFLEYSRFCGNDLSTPRPELNFPGLKEGDCWCLCAGRWLEAYNKGMAPKVFLTRSHQRCLDTIPIELLKEHSLDLT